MMVFQNNRLDQNVRPKIPQRHMLRMIRRQHLVPAMYAMVLVPPVFPYPHTRRNYIFLNLFFNFDGLTQDVMTFGAFFKGFFNNFIDMLRHRPRHPNVSSFLARSLTAFVPCIWLGEFFCALLLLGFDLLF